MLLSHKVDETCKNYFEIEKSKKKSKPVLIRAKSGIKMLFLTIWRFIWIRKTTAEHDDGL